MPRGCCSDGPVMTTDVEETEQNVHAQVHPEGAARAYCGATQIQAQVRRAVRAPDHFNSFLYELMPALLSRTTRPRARRARPLKSGPLLQVHTPARLCPAVALPAIYQRTRRRDLPSDENRPRG